MDHVSEDTALFELVAACRRFYGSIDDLDAKATRLAGVGQNDLRCLNLLATGPVKPGMIAAKLYLTNGSVTTLLDRLEQTGLGPVYRAVAIEPESIAASERVEERRAAVRHETHAAQACEAAL